MDINDLRRRASIRDITAYLDLSNEYGWKLYSYLMIRVNDRKVLASAYECVMREFYRSIVYHNRQGSIELMLYDAADRICGFTEQPKENKRGDPVFWVVFLILLLFNLSCLWAIAGLLMKMELIPVIDFGYHWFHDHVVPLFW